MAKIKPIDETISKEIRKLVEMQELFMQKLRNINKIDSSLSLQEHLSKEESRKLFYNIRYGKN